jgi:hypothetical protein
MSRTLGRVTLAASLVLVALSGAGAPPAGAIAIAVKGSHLVEPGHGRVRLIGVNRSGTEYSCSGDDGQGGHGYGIFQGPVDSRAVTAMRTWRINAVAIPLNEACWLGGYGGLNPQFTGQSYRHAIVAYVKRLNAHGIYAVVRLSGTGPGDNVYGVQEANSEAPMADADHSIAFWHSVASTFRKNRAVLFQTYDEPHDISWDCALNGCTAVSDSAHGEAPDYGSYQTAGQQALVDAIRARGARSQPIVISGIDFAGDESEWERFKPRDPSHALVVSFDDFDYTNQLASQSGNLTRLARHHPVLIGGFGDTDCNSDFSVRLMRFADRHGISYLAWTWNTTEDYGGCQNALLGPLSAYYTGEPSGYGAGVRAHYLKAKHS